jgi:hypothetical protein
MEKVQFLVEAKHATYASGDTASTVILPDGAKELTYQIEDWLYRDRYYGFDPFFGEEVVFLKGKPVWGMNYMGWLVEKGVDAGSVYGFLQAALRRQDVTCPYRGPAEYRDGIWCYLDEHHGSPDLFDGVERILHQDREVFRLVYHGGLIR